jgi:pimeloyl-ACP methyl ester carboxylesterase
VLFFNGIGASLEVLTPLAQAMPDVRFVAFDIPGVGLSPPRSLPYRLWMMARLASKLLDHLEIERVDVLGVSWGGTLAQQFALQHPWRCRRLALAATAQGMPMVPGRLPALRHFITPRRHNDPEHRLRIAGEIYGGPGAHRRQSGSIAARIHQTGQSLLLSVAAVGPHRLDQPALASLATTADLDHGRQRRPDECSSTAS